MINDMLQKKYLFTRRFNKGEPQIRATDLQRYAGKSSARADIDYLRFPGDLNVAKKAEGIKKMIERNIFCVSA
jgi:hypothetical protein